MTIEKINEIQEKTYPIVASRLDENLHECKDGKRIVSICAGTGCQSSKSLKIKEKIEALIKEKGIEDKVSIVTTGCHGLCALGPVMQVYPEGMFYTNIKLDDVEKIVEEHLVKGNPVKELLYKETIKPDKITKVEDTAFFKKRPAVCFTAIISAKHVCRHCLAETARAGYADIFLLCSRDSV